MSKEDIDFLISIQDLEQPDFDNACLERENNRLNKEIDRLNNIISELEKWLNDKIQESDLKGCSFEQTYITGKWNTYKKSLNKLKELKEKE